MAELPKPFSQVESGLPWPRTLFTASAVVFALMLASYFVLAGYGLAVSRQSKDLDQEIQDMAASISPEEIQKLLMLDGQIKSLKELLPQHRFVSRLLEYIEVNTMPQIRLTNFTVNAKKNRVDIAGIAPDAKIISLQAAAYADAKSTDALVIKRIGPGVGGLSFVLEMLFNHNLILPR